MSIRKKDGGHSHRQGVTPSESGAAINILQSSSSYETAAINDDNMSASVSSEWRKLSASPYSVPDDPSLYHSDLSSDNFDVFSRVHEKEPRLQRLLGGLEIMYHLNSSKGMDIICLMTKIATTFPVTPLAVKNALFLLAQKHPMLRMTIECKKTEDISFLEMDHLKLDFSVSERTDWLPCLMEEVAMPFDIENGPLWKCRLLLHSSSHTLEKVNKNLKSIPKFSTSLPLHKFANESTFLFVFHHSIMDGKYVLWVFKQFVEILDKIKLGTNVSINVLENLSLQPPVEDLIVCPQLKIDKVECSAYHSSNGVEKSAQMDESAIRTDFSVPSDETLKAYNLKFFQEIQACNSSPARNDCVLFEFTEKETKQILCLCKTNGVSVNGVFITASLLAFVDLVYCASSRKDFSIPFEFMVDLRRFSQSKYPQDSMKYFPGVASFHVPMIADVHLSKRPVTKQNFLKMARSFGETIQNETRSPETFGCIERTLEEGKTVPNQDKPIGKSPYVLCMSNMGCLDGVFTGDITTRIKLAGVHAHSTVLIEDCPIFFVSNYLLNNKLCLNVSFCENYTSAKTASEYIALFQKNVMSHSKL